MKNYNFKKLKFQNRGWQKNNRKNDSLNTSKKR